MFLKIFYILSILLFIENCLSEERPEVKTKFGTYKGHVIKSRGGRDILSFSGIPYAKPPVGKLRFKDPVELDPNDEIHNAIEASQCPQAKLFETKGPKFVGTEDCLHLNIYAPKLDSSKDLMPVYFWIHGGGFLAGSANESWSGSKYLLDGDRNMVMVAINYRLGVLGFLSANDENLPGNLGLKDQLLALKWVKENIEAFGGDPNSITIGGLSAGGASVAHLMNSKAGKGLFQRAVSQSGTADCSWALAPKIEARDIASKIISYLKCPTEPNELLDCLQNKSSEELMNATDSFKDTKDPWHMYLLPVVEEDSPTAFMTAKSIEEGSNVPWLSGITNEEGLLFFQMLDMFNTGISDLSILKEQYKELLPIFAYYSYNTRVNEITEKLKDYYFGDKEFSKDTVKQFVQLLSDRMFNHGQHISAKNHKGNMFMYMLSYKGHENASFFGPVSGFDDSFVAHGGDLYFFFPNIKNIELKGYDLEMSNIMINMWYNFIKTGNPTPDTHIWEESSGGHKYMDFTNNGTIMKSDFFKERMEFLDKLDISSSIPSEII